MFSSPIGVAQWKQRECEDMLRRGQPRVLSGMLDESVACRLQRSQPRSRKKRRRNCGTCGSFRAKPSEDPKITGISRISIHRTSQESGRASQPTERSRTHQAMPTLPTKSLFDKDLSLRSPFPRHVPAPSAPPTASSNYVPSNPPSARTDFSQIKRPTPVKPKPSATVSESPLPPSDVPLSLRNLMNFPVFQPPD
jgi:hypothetical protein